MDLEKKKTKKKIHKGNHERPGSVNLGFCIELAGGGGHPRELRKVKGILGCIRGF